MSLRLRLNLLVAVLNLGFLVALTWILINIHRESIKEEIEATHRVTVQMLGTMAQTSPMVGPAPVVMTSYVQSLGRVRANEIRLYDHEGQLRFTSPPSAYKAGRQAPEWFDRLMHPDLQATVIRLPGAIIEVLPDASRAIIDAWDDMMVIVLLGVGFVAILHTALLLLLRHLLSPTEDDARRLVATTRALAENREVTRIIHERIEAERKRLARELHDELGQSVTAIRLIATTMARGGSPMPVDQAITQINQIAMGLYDSVHRIVRELRPAVLEQPDLGAALHDLAREWRQHHPAIELILHSSGDISDLGEHLTLAVYRAVQEALTNVLKHAGASRVQVDVTRSDEVLHVCVEDNGQGGSPTLKGSGHGIAGMRERIRALEGDVVAERNATGGFRVSIHIPLFGESD